MVVPWLKLWLDGMQHHPTPLHFKLCSLTAVVRTSICTGVWLRAEIRGTMEGLQFYSLLTEREHSWNGYLHRSTRICSTVFKANETFALAALALWFACAAFSSAWHTSTHSLQSAYSIEFSICLSVCSLVMGLCVWNNTMNGLMNSSRA